MRLRVNEDIFFIFASLFFKTFKIKPYLDLNRLHFTSCSKDSRDTGYKDETNLILRRGGEDVLQYHICESCPEQLVIHCAVSSDTLTPRLRENVKLPSVWNKVSFVLSDSEHFEPWLYLYEFFKSVKTRINSLHMRKVSWGTTRYCFVN